MQAKTLLVLALVGIALGANVPSRQVGVRNHPRRIGTGEKIVGGGDANPGQFPWIVSLQWVSPGDRYHNCGGSILNTEWVLTAAHCIVGLSSNGHYVVVAGEHDFETNEGNEQEVLVSEMIKHELYPDQPVVAANDIALIKLATPLVFNQWVSAIALPASGASHSGDATLSGWGSISPSFFPEMPTTLQTAQLPILTNAVCRDAYSPPTVEDSMICTGPLSGGFSACSGDSGGPLVVGTEVVGVVSWGTVPCGSSNSPSVYTRTASFIDWINGKITA